MLWSRNIHMQQPDQKGARYLSLLQLSICSVKKSPGNVFKVLAATLKCYYDPKIISFFSSDFESVFA